MGRGKGLLLLFLLLCLVGLGVALELTSVHVHVYTDPEYRSFCAVNEAVNCEVVAESPYSVLFGVPISVWGLLGYGIMAALAFTGLLRRSQVTPTWPAGWLLLLAGVSCLASLTLGTISTLAIRSLCILCLVTYLINAILLVLAILLSQRRGGLRIVAAEAVSRVQRQLIPHAAVGAGLGVVVLLLILLYPTYWETRSSAGTELLPHGQTADGHWWIGAVEPTLTIVEFSDYQCPHCQRGHQELRAFTAAHPQQVRFIHRHFPLDMACNSLVKRPFHPEACEMARWVVCAGRQQKAWEANDLLFSEPTSQKPVRASQLVRQLGLRASAFEACLADPTSLDPIRDDIAAGLRLGVRGTPTLVVGGKIYPGHIPEEELQRLLGLPEQGKAPGTAPAATGRH